MIVGYSVLSELPLIGITPLWTPAFLPCGHNMRPAIESLLCKVSDQGICANINVLAVDAPASPNDEKPPLPPGKVIPAGWN